MAEIITVKMPDIGEGVVEGEVIEWLKNINDQVLQDEPVVIVMTDKATVELPSPYFGTLVRQHVSPGQLAVKDKPLYDLEVLSKVQSKMAEPALPKLNFPSTPPPSQPSSSDLKPSQNKIISKSSASPPIRKMAKDLGIDIDVITATGKDNHITSEDIKNHLASKELKTKSTPINIFPEDEIIPFMGIQNLMAQKMKESKREIPHFSYFEQVEAQRLVQLRQNMKSEAQKIGLHLTYMPFLIKALSLTIQRFPSINSSIDTVKNALIQHKCHHIGIAISTRLGLIVPVLKNVESMPLNSLVENYENLKYKASENKLQPAEMQGSTITISNFGVLGGGGLWATPIINFPEVAIVAVSKIHKQPLVKNDAVVIKDVLNLSWSFDHRVIDGHLAASISHFFSTLIQNPASLL